MFGGRSGGLRETKSLAFEMGECFLPPDSDAGKVEEKRTEVELREKYFKLPPSKRVNYAKLAINSPFVCPWEILLKDWSSTPVDEFFVLRNRNNLSTLQVNIVISFIQCCFVSPNKDLYSTGMHNAQERITAITKQYKLFNSSVCKNNRQRQLETACTNLSTATW